MTALRSGGHEAGGRFRRLLHVVAVLTACGVFPLIVAGAGVTSKDAGMAYSDWPTSAGHLVNPPQWWQRDDTRWEHGHRLIGWVVGMLAMLLAAMTWRSGGRVRRLGLATLGAIAVQGVLGGLRVAAVSVPLAMVHGVWGQVCFCLAATTALVTSRAWIGARVFEARAVGFLRRLCVVGTGLVFVQLLLGAAYRHLGTSATLIAHIFGAIVVSFVAGWIAMWVMGQHPGRHLLARLGQAVGVLMATQLLLGGGAFVVTVLKASGSPFLVWAVPSAHVAVGALMLVSMVLLTLVTFRVLSPAGMERGAGAMASAATS